MAGKKFGVAEIILAVGGALLVVGALLPWFGPANEHEIFASEQTVNGLMRFSYFGWLTALIGLVVLELVQLKVLVPDRFKLPFPDAVAGMVLGGVTILIGLVEMIWQPMFKDAPNEFIDLQWGLFVTLLGGIVVVVGGFLQLANVGGAASTASAAGGGYAQYPPAQYPGAAPYTAQPMAPQYQAAPPWSAAPAPPAAPASPVATAAPAVAAPPPAPAAPVAAAAAPAAPVPDAAPTPAADTGADQASTAFCTSCGAAYPVPDAVFCASCGAKRG